MTYLIDSNILIRLVQHSDAMHHDAQNAYRMLRLQSEELCIIPQNLIEFWAVATRPIRANGLGLTINETLNESSLLRRLFILKPDTATIFSEWENLVVKYQVIGKQTHDTRLVAAMTVHQISHLLTFNTNDFKRFTEITAIDPRSIASTHP